ncbi:MAG: hypothetical protein V4844_02820 [Pseudomonadota bacterium]
MNSFVDLRWVERAAARLVVLDELLSYEDALSMARALALQPAFKTTEPEGLVDKVFAQEGRLRRPAKRSEALTQSGESGPAAASA